MKRDFSLPGRSPVIAADAAVATSHALATASALTILKEGGNAIDAAISAAAVLCVVEPHMTNVGGDCFAIIGEADGTLHGLNGSGRAPQNAHLEWYLENGFTEIPEPTVHAFTTPGSVKAWETMHQKFGRTDFARLFADAIHYAENGYPVAPRVAQDWAQSVEKLKGNPTARENLLINDKAPVAGDVVSNPKFAETLRTIANGGAQAFYQGEIADELCAEVQEQGGFLTQDDLNNVSADWVDLISTDYKGHTLYEIPPNGQGLAAIILVKLLAKIGVSESLNSLERAHLEAECGRIAYAARDEYIADIDYMKYTVEELLSDAHIEKLAKLFDPEKRNPEIKLPDPTGSDTIYLSIVDRDGLTISFINSLFGSFGTGIMMPKSGILLQNRGCGFNLKQGHGNAIGPLKRPLHTIIPAMVKQGDKISYSYGVMGGPYQAMGHGHVLSNLLDYGMDPQTALDDPRIFWDKQGALELESRIGPEVQAGLEAKGHPCVPNALHGGGQVIQIDHERGVLIAGSDPRKDGHAAGY